MRYIRRLSSPQRTSRLIYILSGCSTVHSRAERERERKRSKQLRALVIRIRHNGDARGAARRTRGRRVERSGAEPSGGRSPPLCAPSVNAMRAVTVRRASDADWSGAFASPLFALLCFAPRLHKLRTNLLLLIQCTVLHAHCTVCARHTAQVQYVQNSTAVLVCTLHVQYKCYC